MPCTNSRATIRKSLPDDIAAELIASADNLLSSAWRLAARRGLLAAGFARFAKWFAETEPARRTGVDRVVAEVDGALDLDVGRGFRLTARADRIDLGEDGSAVIYDYKTGRVPTVETGRQALRAAASARSCDRRRRRLRRCRSARGARPHLHQGVGTRRWRRATAGGERKPCQSCREGARRSRPGSSSTSIAPTRPTKRSAVRAPPSASIYDYDDYEHLARLAEWVTLGLEEEIW